MLIIMACDTKKKKSEQTKYSFWSGQELNETMEALQTPVTTGLYL